MGMFHNSLLMLNRSATFLTSHMIESLQQTSIAAELSYRGDGERSSRNNRDMEGLQRAHAALQHAASADVDEVVRFHAARGLYALQALLDKQVNSLLLPGAPARSTEWFTSSSSGMSDVGGRWKIFKEVLSVAKIN